MNDPESPSDNVNASEAAAQSSASSATGSAEVDLALEIARLEAALRESTDRNLRTQAELENFRKRSRRELDDEKRYAALPLVRDILHVLDNLQRAIEASEKTAGGSGLLEGVRMVALQLSTFLEQHQCRPIHAAGAAFDPHWHEAIGQIPCQDVPAGHVAQVTRAGYTLHDRVVRPAQVLVSIGAPVSPKEV